jgi:hypothetical protein
LVVVGGRGGGLFDQTEILHLHNCLPTLRKQYSSKGTRTQLPQIHLASTQVPLMWQKFLDFLLPVSVVEPHWFNADPDTDPDPAFFLIADPDPVPDSGLWWPKI